MPDSKPRIDQGVAVLAFDAEEQAKVIGEEWGPENRDKWRWRPIAPTGPTNEPATNRVTRDDLKPFIAATVKPALVTNKNIVRKK